MRLGTAVPRFMPGRPALPASSARARRVAAAALAAGLACGLALDRGAAQTPADTLAEDDVPGVVLEPGSIQITEGASASYKLALASQPTGTVTVTMTTDLAATDLSVDSPVLQFTTDNWNQPQTVTVSVAEDLDAVDDPPVTLQHAASGGNYAGVSVPPVTVTIVEQTVPTLSVAGGTTQEGGSVIFVVMLSAPSSRSVVVGYETADGTAVSPDDYTATSSSLVFSPGEMSKTVTVATRNDLLRESSETFRLRLGSPRNARLQTGAGAATATILDTAPAPTGVILSLGRYSLEETAAAWAAAVSASLVGSPAPRATQVTVAAAGGTATPGADYAVLSALTVTIPEGQTNRTAQLWFDPVADGLYEGDETVILRASAAGLAAGTAILTIADSDLALPTVTLSLGPRSVSESASRATLTVTASVKDAVPAQTQVSVSLTGATATPGADYAAVPAFTVTIEAGQTAGTAELRFEPLDDALEECDETVLFTGSGAGLNAGTATLRITDDNVSRSDCNQGAPSITMWTDRLAYAIEDEIRLYLDIDPQGDRGDYTFFFYLENIEAGQRLYFAPGTGSTTLWNEVVDQDGRFEGNWWPARAQRVETELIWQGRVPDPGLWHFVAEIRSPGTTQLLKRAYAKFVVPQNGFRLLNRRGTERVLASDTQWTNDLVYDLGDRLYVISGATLAIEAGTLVRAKGPDAAIIVQEGGRIEVRGRREAPVVFTCGRSPVGQRVPGCWAGLQVRGTAAAFRSAEAP